MARSARLHKFEQTAAKDGLTVGMRDLCFKSIPLLFSHRHASTEVAFVHEHVKAAEKESQCLERDPNKQNVGVRHICGEILDSAVGNRQDGCAARRCIPKTMSANGDVRHASVHKKESAARRTVLHDVDLRGRAEVTYPELLLKRVRNTVGGTADQQGSTQTRYRAFMTRKERHTPNEVPNLSWSMTRSGIVTWKGKELIMPAKEEITTGRSG